MARKSLVTDNLQVKILQYIRAGCYIRIACLASGVSERDYFNWMKWGEERQSGAFFQFFQAIKKAEAEGEARLVLLVENAAPSNWQAAMTILERKYPDRWGKRDKVDVTSGGHAIKGYIGISPEDWDKDQEKKDSGGDG